MVNINFLVWEDSTIVWDTLLTKGLSQSGSLGAGPSPNFVPSIGTVVCSISRNHFLSVALATHSKPSQNLFLMYISIVQHNRELLRTSQYFLQQCSINSPTHIKNPGLYHFWAWNHDAGSIVVNAVIFSLLFVIVFDLETQI